MKILTVIMIVMSFSSYCEIKKDIKKENLIEKKIQSLEKKIEILEKKVIMLEKKLLKLNSNSNEEFQIKYLSKEIIENENKGIVKIEALIKNNTSKTVKLIFGQIHIIDAITKREVFLDNFYYDKPLIPSEYEKIIIAVPSSHSSYLEVKKLTDIIIKFTPKVVKN